MDQKNLAKKWQTKWEESKLFEATPDNRQKFFLNFPYPYMNAVPHIGHFYTLMRVEAFARYKRLKGFNVLFPQAWHCTGSPIISGAKRIEEGEEKQIKSLKEQGFSDSQIEKFKNPEEWTKVFPVIWEKAFAQLGISYDKRRSFITTSLNPYYDKFIKWQFRKLKEKGYVGKGKHPVVWDPKTNMPVGDHDRVKGEGEVPQEFVLLKFKFGNEYIIAATLRPETVFGQTNLWVDPDLNYVKAEVNGETWIISKECSEKLKDQERAIKITGSVEGKQLLGKYARAPGIGRDIIILPSSFCDPDKGTGIVTSVPSDAPDDYIGLRDLWQNPEESNKYGINHEEIKKIKVIPIIDSKDLGSEAAVKIVEDMGIKNQNERAKLEKAKKIAYKKGFYEGVMNKSCGKHAGKKVEEAKEDVKEELISNNEAELFYEITGEVVSRSLTKCIVKIVSNQWFLKYGDKEWKKQVQSALKDIALFPELARSQFEYVIDWLNDWACTREYGLGTKLPFDDEWLIESLSDSTVYMAYYTVAHKITELPIEEVNDELFDYVFYGKGKPGKEIAKDLRNEFDYWYPVDFRNSGKDLVQNHLTFFLFNHIAIFDKKYWPKGIGVNGWVRVEGEKMSKSLGNMIPLTKLADEYGADSCRISILSGGEGLDDPNWDSSFAKSIGSKLFQFYTYSVENYGKGDDNRTNIDDWMDNELNSIIQDTEQFMEKTMFRSAIQRGFFDLQKAIKWYSRRRSNPNKQVVQRVIEAQTILLSCFTPYICEEIWQKCNKEKFVSETKWPEIVKVTYKGNEALIEKVLNDIINITRMVKIKPKKVHIYSIPTEKELLVEAAEFFSRELTLEISVMANNENGIYDPQNKAQRAKPGKPAILLE